MFIEKNDGQLNDNRVLEIQTIKVENGSTKIEELDCEIVGLLRYEYALNYLNKVGVSVTRIGLGYTTPRKT